MRQPSVFVRSLRPYEAQKLKGIAKRSKQFWRRQRANILLASDSGMSAPQIADLWRTDENHIRGVIKEFNEEGFESLNPTEGGGCPRRIDDDAVERIVAVALSRPRDLGVPINRWSLRRLADYLTKREGIDVSAEHLRRILKSKGITYQRTKTWKSSPDPDYERKKDRILRLYQRAERGRLKDDEVVVCFDECGPLSLRPWLGSGWFKTKKPKRMRATFRRPHGVSYLFGAYDIGADRLFGDIRKAKDAAEVLRFLKKIRARYPAHVRIHLALDNLSTHTTADIRRWARRNKVTLVLTPTYASHLNRIEAHFGAYKEFVINGSDYQSVAELVAATRAYLGMRNHRTRGVQIRERENRRKVA